MKLAIYSNRFIFNGLAEFYQVGYESGLRCLINDSHPLASWYWEFSELEDKVQFVARKMFDIRPYQYTVIIG